MNCFKHLVDLPNHKHIFLRQSYVNPTPILRNCGTLHCLLRHWPPENSQMAAELAEALTPTKILRQSMVSQF